MKRFFAAVMAGVGVIVLGGALSAPVQASVHDFTFSSFEADYYVGSDKQGRSTLKTVEKLTAEFPSADQNHGIDRAIPNQYDGHSTSLKIESVTDETGKALAYEKRDDSNGNTVLRIGDADTYVHGTKRYVITYTQRDVTRYFKDTKKDEFYWDTNGTEWQQPFGRVTARVHLSKSVLPTFTGETACYQGTSEANARCDISREGSVVTATAANMGPGQNMTVALGFTPGTWRGYEQSLSEKIWAIVRTVFIVSQIVTGVIAFILIFVLSIKYSRASNRSSELGTIVTEYIPPKGRSVLAAAKIGDGTKADVTAQLIDLAVRHYLKLYEVSEKSLMKQAEYELEVVKSPQTLSEEERQLLTTLFGADVTVGSRLEMKRLKNDYKVSAQLQKDGKALDELIKGAYGLRRKDAAASGWFKKVGIVLLVLAVPTLSIGFLIVGLIALVCASTLTVLSDEGLALRRYMAGLKRYIDVAEEERLKLLQSPEGAEKVGRNVAGSPKQLVKLYERVLPYAVLFGQEKEWNKQLGAYYEQTGTQPDWYAGHTAFNAAVFSSAVSDFNSTMNSYAASTSSSSGGSSGGGSSGGGGGGGGGGGW